MRNLVFLFMTLMLVGTITSCSDNCVIEEATPEETVAIEQYPVEHIVRCLEEGEETIIYSFVVNIPEGIEQIDHVSFFTSGNTDLIRSEVKAYANEQFIFSTGVRDGVPNVGKNNFEISSGTVTFTLEVTIDELSSNETQRLVTQGRLEIDGEEIILNSTRWCVAP